MLQLIYPFYLNGCNGIAPIKFRRVQTTYTMNAGMNLDISFSTSCIANAVPAGRTGDVDTILRVILTAGIVS